MKNSEKKLRKMLHDADMDTVEQIAEQCPAAEDAAKERIFSGILARQTHDSAAEAAAQSVTVIHRKSHRSIWAAAACLLLCCGVIGGISLLRPSMTEQQKLQEFTKPAAEVETDRASAELPKETQNAEHSAKPADPTARETAPVPDASEYVQMQQPVQDATEATDVEQQMESTQTEPPVETTNPIADNDYTFSYRTLSADYHTDDGQLIPAGSVAVSVSVSKNTGFDCGMLHLKLSGSHPIHTDSSGTLIMEKGKMLRKALISGAEGGNELYIAIAAPELITTNGELFTFFVEGTDSDFVTDYSAKHEITPDIFQINKTEHSDKSWQDTPDGPMYTTWHYLCGDADDNGTLNLADSVYILRTCSNNRVPNNELSVSEIDDDAETWKKYFPTARSAECADANRNTYITIQDAKDVLDYLTICEAGKKDAYKGRIGFAAVDMIIID